MPNQNYFVRAGAADWDSVVNFVSLSTQTVAGVAPGSPLITAVYITSATLTYTTVSGSGGYEIDASSNQFAGGIVFSSVTTNNALGTLTVTGLDPDTTYYFNVGALWNGATTYSVTQPSTSTLTNLINPSVLSVSSQSVTVSWPAFASGASTNTAQGYELDASTSSSFITYTSSTTTAVTQSTLTITGLTPFTTYYLRAGAANWDSVVNFVGLSTQTVAGAAPGSPTITAVYITSATLSWTTVSGSNGYEIDASSNQFAGGIVFSTVTTNNALGTLTVTGLDPDTTYYFNIGALWDGATTYSGTQPSTSTLTNLISPSVLSVSSESVTVGWPAFASGSSTDTAQGYELDASTSSNFITYTSSKTVAVAQSTLTISGLTPFTTYYLRAGAANWDSVVNFVSISTQTSAGAAPGSVSLTAVYVTSATLSWTTVGGSGGYEVDASSTQFFGGVVLSTVDHQ